MRANAKFDAHPLIIGLDYHAHSHAKLGGQPLRVVEQKREYANEGPSLDPHGFDEPRRNDRHRDVPNVVQKTMDRERVGDDVVENERLLAGVTIAGQQPDQATAVLEARELGGHVTEAASVGRDGVRMQELEERRKGADTVVERMVQALERLIHEIQPFVGPFHDIGRCP